MKTSETVAVKRCLKNEPGTTADAEASYVARRVLEEMEMLKRLDCPGIPRFIDSFQVHAGDGTVEMDCLVMEFIDGTDLNQQVRDSVKLAGQLPDPLVSLDYAIQVCKILEHLHGLNPPVVHRDVKPSNMILRHVDSRVYLVDFGFARPIGLTSGTKSMVGTLGYAPLEQCQGQPTPRSDQYGVGATLFFLLTGQQPTPFAIEPVSKIRDDLPKRLERCVAKATNQNQDLRYRQISDLRKELESISEELRKNKSSPTPISSVSSRDTQFSDRTLVHPLASHEKAGSPWKPGAKKAAESDPSGDDGSELPEGRATSWVQELFPSVDASGRVANRVWALAFLGLCIVFGGFALSYLPLGDGLGALRLGGMGLHDSFESYSERRVTAGQKISCLKSSPGLTSSAPGVVSFPAVDKPTDNPYGLCLELQSKSPATLRMLYSGGETSLFVRLKSESLKRSYKVEFTKIAPKGAPQLAVTTANLRSFPATEDPMDLFKLPGAKPGELVAFDASESLQWRGPYLELLCHGSLQLSFVVETASSPFTLGYEFK